MPSPGKAFLLVSIGLVLGGVHYNIAPGARCHKHPAATQHSMGLESSSGSVCREHGTLTNTQRPPRTTLTPGCGFAHLIDQVRTAAEMDNAKTTSTPAPAPSFAVNETAHIFTWAPSWVQQEEGSNFDILSYPVDNYDFHAALAASGPLYPRREDPFTEAGGLLWLKLVFKLTICALGHASLVGKSKPRR